MPVITYVKNKVSTYFFLDYFTCMQIFIYASIFEYAFVYIWKL